MLGAIMLNVADNPFMLSVVMLNVILLSVVVPFLSPILDDFLTKAADDDEN